MRDTVAALFGLTFVVIGGALLTGDISQTDTSQTARLVGGASFFSLGLLNLWFALKNWLKWKRDCREYRND